MSETQAAPSESSVERMDVDDAIVRAETFAHKAADLGRKTAERIPAAVVVVVGGTVLLAADAFGVGEVITAGIAGYAAYRLLRRRAAKKSAAAKAQAA